MFRCFIPVVAALALAACGSAQVTTVTQVSQHTATTHGMSRARAARIYQADVAPAQAALTTFLAKASAWTDATTGDQADADSQPVVDSMDTLTGQLLTLAQQYPPAASDIKSQVKAYTTVEGDLAAISSQNVFSAASWVQHFATDAASSKAASDVVRSDLGLPVTTDSPTATQTTSAPATATTATVATTPSPGSTDGSSCSPKTNAGNCYEPGEYCRAGDHGMSGIDGNGDPITCADNNGWRWEPATSSADTSTTTDATPAPTSTVDFNAGEDLNTHDRHLGLNCSGTDVGPQSSCGVANEVAQDVAAGKVGGSSFTDSVAQGDGVHSLTFSCMVSPGPPSAAGASLYSCANPTNAQDWFKFLFT